MSGSEISLIQKYHFKIDCEELGKAEFCSKIPPKPIG